MSASSARLALAIHPLDPLQCSLPARLPAATWHTFAMCSDPTDNAAPEIVGQDLQRRCLERLVGGHGKALLCCEIPRGSLPVKGGFGIPVYAQGLENIVKRLVGRARPACG